MNKIVMIIPNYVDYCTYKSLMDNIIKSGKYKLVIINGAAMDSEEILRNMREEMSKEVPGENASILIISDYYAQRIGYSPYIGQQNFICLDDNLTEEKILLRVMQIQCH
jgi:hypothetical protein